MSNYWAQRQKKQKDRLYNKSLSDAQKKLASLYRETEKRILIDMQDLFLHILNDGEVLVSELYRYNRYYKLRQSINQALQKMGEEELNALNDNAEDLYRWTSSQVFNNVGFDAINEQGGAELLKSMWEANGKYWSSNTWCADGKDTTQRLTENLKKLQNTLERGLVDCVARGTSKDELVKTLKRRFEVSFSEADRLARTELTYIQNQATRDSYKKADVKRYKFLAASDDRVSDMCKALNGKEFNLDAAAVGINYPPMHVNCRCTTIPVIN